MTSIAHLTSEPSAESPQPSTWDPPCVSCLQPIGIQMPAGKYVGAIRCEKCRGVVSLQRLRSAGIPEWFIAQNASLKTFDNRSSKSLVNAVRKCRELLAPKTLFDRTWLILTGNEGSGKSHLAAAIAAEFLAAGHTVQFITFDDLLMEILSSYRDESSESVKDVVERFTRNAYCLVLDDVGVEQPTPHTIQVLYRILNQRLNDKRPTIITTNYPLTKKRDGQPTLGERLSQKLSEDTQVRRILDRIAGEAMHEHLDVTSYRRAQR